MPSSATITAFYSFSANTKARANQVNNNFSTFRGHIIAIDPNTATAATTETYDLGSTEYRWRTGYFREVDFKSNTSTGQALQIVGDTAAGSGAFLFKRAGNTTARLGGGNNYVDLDTTTSQFDFKYNGSTITSLTNTKFVLPKRTLYSSGVTSTSASQFTTTVSLVCTLSVTSYGGNVLLGVNINDNGSGLIALTNQTTGGVGRMYLYFYRDNTSTLVHLETWAVGEMITTTAAFPYAERSSFGTFIDSSCTSGNHTYYLYVKQNRVSPAVNMNFTNIMLQALEVV